MARKLQLAAVLLGVIVFGFTRIDVYTIHDAQVALFPIQSIVYWSPSFDATLLLLGSFGYHLGIISLIARLRSHNFPKFWVTAAILSFLSEAVFVFYMIIGSGYQNHEAYVGTLLALALLIPSLIALETRSQQAVDRKPYHVSS